TRFLLRLLARLTELLRKLVGFLSLRPDVGERIARSDRFDPPPPRADGAFGQDHEGTDLGGPADVRAAAELPREAGNLDHADDVPVLLAEEHHRADTGGLVGAA